jgi:hypothetical protein
MMTATRRSGRGNPNFKRGVGNPYLKKGTHPQGRAKGTPNKISRELKEAIIYGMEHSKHSKDGTVESYMVAVADKRMDLMVPLAGKLLPLQINSRNLNISTSKAPFESREKMLEALLARGITQAVIDSLMNNCWKKPEPVEVLGDVKHESSSTALTVKEKI